MQIVVYLFCGGTSGGILLCACAWELLFSHHAVNASWRERLAFDAFFARCLVVGAITLLASVLCLLWDLGRPERALNLFLTDRPTILSFGALFLAADLVTTLLLGAVSFMKVNLRQSAKRVLVGACAALSFFVIVYTGLYLYSLEAVAFWHTPALLAIFLFSSLSCGIAAMLLVAYFSPGSALILGKTRPVQKTHAACIVLEAASVIAFLGAAFCNPNAARSVSLLTSAQILPLATIGVGLFALAIPLAFDMLPSTSKLSRNIPACDVICLAGGFLLRYCIVFCGVH